MGEGEATTAPISSQKIAAKERKERKNIAGSGTPHREGSRFVGREFCVCFNRRLPGITQGVALIERHLKRAEGAWQEKDCARRMVNPG